MEYGGEVEGIDTAFLEWWGLTHNWDFTGKGLYEKHAKKCFYAGYRSAGGDS
jgi:hypothetical protein